MTRRALLLALLGLALVAQPAAADKGKDDEDKDDDAPSPRAAARFPQPIAAGQLIGRDVLANLESQPVLGHVRAVVRVVVRVVVRGPGEPDGQPSVVVGVGGWFGWGERPVAVPLAALSLLGGFVVATGLTPDQLARLPTYDGTGTPLAAGEVVAVGLTKPAH